MHLARKILLLALLAITASCGSSQHSIPPHANNSLVVGAAKTDTYLPLLRNRRVALVANQTSLVDGVHLVDTLLSSGIEVKEVFVPEHGFRGNVGAGDHVANETDPKTGLPLVSLYGKNKKPSAESLANIDLLVFDIQDVGARFYTYISTLHYVLEAGAELGIPVVVFDRPNPNGHYIDGPVLELGYSSFVGLDPIPVVYGMTMGELAKMMIGEKWIAQAEKAQLSVIAMDNWNHNSEYTLPVAPSPNLSTANAINHYASLCFFEGTTVSVGRGTQAPFETIGYPEYPEHTFQFVPQDIAGKVNNPPHEGKTCYGIDLRKDTARVSQLELKWLMEMYSKCPNKEKFFTSPDFFDKLAGTNSLRKQLEQGLSESEIRKSWQPGLNEFAEKRKKYLLYDDFQ